MSKGKTFFHVDIDAFFASVEQLDNPEYRGKPVIVGGQSERGVVSTCSYEARKFGVHSAMPILQAKKLCPNGIFLRGRMGRYHEKSKEVMSIFKDFTPEIKQISVDEAFLNMTGMEKIFGEPRDSALLLKKTIKEKTGLTVSVGCARTKYIAKIASGRSKPDGLFIVPLGQEIDFMKSLPLEDIWGIGGKTRERLVAAGLSTVPQIFNSSEHLLQTILGNAGGSFLYQAVRGELYDVFTDDVKSHSISTERTFEHDLFSHIEINDVLFYLASELMYRIFDEKIKGKTVSVKIRYNDFKTVSVQSTGSVVNDTQDLFERAKELFYKKFDNKTPIRLLGLCIMNVESDIPEAQSELFYSEKNIKKRKVEETMYALTKKEGKNILKPARLLQKNKEGLE
ncbi:MULTISPECIES: DNA polymerase IV [unclassified Treponema]|uniref:DNA polymerase IV n=1 Tax=unclassified Treponema TaxID=2638727 RepID=UPI0020A54132|nr:MULTISPECIES: DNA polymerase IV [unclassified Treponema]UTC66224.1 DNA polymerase IV [Treponema sp. OMZ 789]UTC68953.1 DNA polymerase IV [Treponema sp. OMZ 790]UTC71680.1 DNA polymerase IV [Treponema sp. OMZ 791]